MSSAAALAASCSELNLAEIVKPGVYVLVRGDRAVYVGQSDNVLVRIGNHVGRFDFDRIFLIPEAIRIERMAIEGALARRFNPEHCNRASRKHSDRDREILARFGLEPHDDNATAFTARTGACWTSESRAKAGRTTREWHQRKKAHRKRWLRLRVLLWQAIQPHAGAA